MPYRINASFGPTFLYIRAMTIMIIKSPRTSDPAMTTTSIGNPNIRTPLFHPRGLIASYFSPSNPLLRELFPPLYVSDSLVIPLDHDFRTFLNGLAVTATRAGAAPRPTKGKNDFPGAVLANWHAQCSERTFYAPVFAAHGQVIGLDKLHHEFENHPPSEKARQHRDCQ